MAIKNKLDLTWNAGLFRDRGIVLQDQNCAIFRLYTAHPGMKELKINRIICVSVPLLFDYQNNNVSLQLFAIS